MDRLEVKKTYKLFIGGAFPRSESRRSYQPVGSPSVNVSRGSRKDVRDAVVAARGAFSGWSGRTGYNRGQILFRIAEMLETRSRSMVDELVFKVYPLDEDHPNPFRWRDWAVAHGIPQPPSEKSEAASSRPCTRSW